MEKIVNKTRRLLQIVFVAFLIILFRVWHLGVVQREEKLIEAQKPQQRQILLHANRGTITDRFGVPLAVNRICYNATIYYGQISQIPIVSWKADESGQRVRVYTRREYIRQLSTLLSSALDLEAERIEDLIHSKASLFPHVPYLIKANLSEEEYYQLKVLEKDWLGIRAEIGAERYYPQGKTAAHLIGTMGAINQREYLSIAEEMRQLQEKIEDLDLAYPGSEEAEKAQSRLLELKEKAYTLNDLVGKSGAEGQFEELLRGTFGKTTYEVDQKGRFVRELPGAKPAVAGERISLTISSELQQFAEHLLAQSEKERMRKPPKQPWIRGGAIVALDPHTGEVLAMASYPSFDPNDFIPTANPSLKKEKQKRVHRWFESERWLGWIWEGKETLGGPKYEGISLSWDLFLELILPPDSPLTLFFQKVSDIKTAVQVQEDFEALRYFAKNQDPFAAECKEAPLSKKRLGSLLSEIPTAADKLFAIDLCRIVADATRFTDPLLSQMGSMKLSTYFSLSQAFHRFEALQKPIFQKEFHKNEFKKWREENQKQFLGQKRAEEKAHSTYARPYIDYLDQKERELFEEFWNENRLSILSKYLEQEETLAQTVPTHLREALLHTFRSFSQLQPKEKALASAFYPKGGLGFSRSYAFQTSAPQGSIFKLVSGYEGLKQGINFSLIDELGYNEKGTVVAYSMNRTPYPRIYKGGRLPKSSASHIGPIDMIGALEQSSNPYFSILAGDHLKSPEDLLEAAKLFGFGTKTQIDLPGETSGKLPDDLSRNKTGLYSFAIGQHTLLSTPLQSALFLSMLANKGSLLKPQILFKDITPQVKRHDPIPSSIRSQLFEGMDRSLWSSKGGARPTAIRSLLANPAKLHDYLSLQHQMIGKTGTAEILWNPFRNPSSKAYLHKHIWFGSIAFPSDTLSSKSRWEKPELVVVVMQRYGESGKELAPLAAQMIRKWREIKKKHALK